jgi:hypothetical protein
VVVGNPAHDVIKRVIGKHEDVCLAHRNLLGMDAGKCRSRDPFDGVASNTLLATGQRRRADRTVTG